MGSTRVVFDSSGALYQWTSYEPFGKTVPGNPETDRLSWIGKEKDEESDLGDFGVRKYDEETGRFLSTDPLWELGRDVHPYQYGHNNPLRRADKNGKWDVDVHFFHDRSQQPLGKLNVRNNKGEVVFSMIVKGTGVGGHDGTKKNSDTPTGEYDIIGWRTPTEKERKSYGPNPRLVLVGLSGEIFESGRTDIRVHGGRQEIKDKDGNWVPLENAKLKDTHGCMRCKDGDVKDMKAVTDALEKNDPNEKPGVLTVTNDIRDPKADQPVDPSKDKK